MYIFYGQKAAEKLWEKAKKNYKSPTSISGLKSSMMLFYWNKQKPQVQIKYFNGLEAFVNYNPFVKERL